MKRFDGHRIRQARKELGLSQSELARLADIGEQNIGRWERGHHRPELDSLARLADVLQKPVDYFYVDDLTDEERDAQEVYVAARADR